MFLGLHFFPERITLGTLHVIQSTFSTVYWQIHGLKTRVENLVGSVFCISAFFVGQSWIKEQQDGKGRVNKYTPKVPSDGEKRGMRIEARGLSFSYSNGGVKVLKDINLTVNAGETLAIVGFNGSGKSTLSKVLTGLYDYEGSLLIDGIEARTYNRESLHRYMTVCPQNFARLSLSIRENIGIGQVDQIEDITAIKKAAERGGADEVLAVHGLNKIISPIPISNTVWNTEEPPETTQTVTANDKKKPSINETTEKSVNQDKKQVEVNDSAIKSLDGEKKKAKIRTKSNALTEDGEFQREVSLSGGQMQRVALSRAFMRADKATLVVLE